MGQTFSMKSMYPLPLYTINSICQIILECVEISYIDAVRDYIWTVCPLVDTM